MTSLNMLKVQKRCSETPFLRIERIFESKDSMTMWKQFLKTNMSDEGMLRQERRGRRCREGKRRLLGILGNIGRREEGFFMRES